MKHCHDDRVASFRTATMQQKWHKSSWMVKQEQTYFTLPLQQEISNRLQVSHRSSQPRKLQKNISTKIWFIFFKNKEQFWPLLTHYLLHYVGIPALLSCEVVVKDTPGDRHSYLGILSGDTCCTLTMVFYKIIRLQLQLPVCVCGYRQEWIEHFCRIMGTWQSGHCRLQSCHTWPRPHH